jgi:D-alanine-D-alanine ligase
MNAHTLTVKQLGRIGVLMGGCSSERAISLKSGKAVLQALTNTGCDVVPIELNTVHESEIITQLTQADIDIAFLVLHGKFGEDGTIQTILQNAGIEYTGSLPEASQLAMDKIATQNLLKTAGIKIPDFFVLNRDNRTQIAKILEDFGGCPVVVKPSSEGSSIGITIVHDKEKFESAVDTAFEFGSQILVDRYIAGKEITASVLGTDPLPLVEIRSKNTFFDFAAKYQQGMSEYIVPAQIDAQARASIQEMSGKIFNLVGCRDLARADFILDQTGNAYFLEINTIPGFTATSLLPMAALQAGFDFENLCLIIAGFAAQRKYASCDN